MAENREIKFCACNCGQIVTKRNSRFVTGHGKLLALQEPPLCGCNCGEKVAFDKYKNCWNKYIATHQWKVKKEEYLNKISEKHKVGMVGENNPFYGMRHSDETKEKISKTKTGVNVWEGKEHWGLGKKHTDEHKKKISEAGKGRVHSEESKRKIKESNTGKKFTEEHKNKLSKSAKLRKGEKNSNWRGGVTSLAQQIRHCSQTVAWRKSVFERDNYTCQDCKKRGNGTLHAHHIKQFNTTIIKEYNIHTLEEAIACQELWNLDNGITMCNKYHEAEHKRLNKLEKLKLAT